MKITVAIITRNRANLLKRCLNSLVSQSLKPTEVLVIDNNSFDNTKKVVFSYKKKLICQYIFEAKTGIPFARNRALELARGDILAFIDDDCEAEINWIEQIVKHQSRYKSTAALQGWAESMPKKNPLSIVCEANILSGILGSIQNIADITSLSSLLKKDQKIHIMDTKNVSFKLKLVKKKKLFFNTQIKRGSDIDFAKRLEQVNEDIVFCPLIKIYHLEKASIVSFLIQRFIDARYRTKIVQMWPKQYFPSKGPFWWFQKIYYFMIYAIEKGHLKKLYYIFPLFILGKLASSLGVLSMKKVTF